MHFPCIQSNWSIYKKVIILGILVDPPAGPWRTAQHRCPGAAALDKFQHVALLGVKPIHKFLDLVINLQMEFANCKFAILARL